MARNETKARNEAAEATAQNAAIQSEAPPVAEVQNAATSAAQVSTAAPTPAPIGQPENGAQSESVPKLPFTARYGYDAYTDRDKVRQRYIKITLNNPFPGEDFEDVELACKWRQDKGVFDFKAKKALAQADELIMQGYFTVESFVSKRTKKRVQCVGIRAKNPFFSGEFDLKVRQPEDAAVLALLLSDAWGIHLSRYADDEPVENGDTSLGGDQ